MGSSGWKFLNTYMRFFSMIAKRLGSSLDQIMSQASFRSRRRESEAASVFSRTLRSDWIEKTLRRPLISREAAVFDLQFMVIRTGLALMDLLPSFLRWGREYL